MKQLDFIADILNDILDDDPMANLVPVDGQPIAHAEDATLVMTSTTFVGGVDFDGKNQPQDLAAKLIRVCVARLAAKGAVARNCSLVISVDNAASPDWVRAFADGLATDLTEYGLSLIHCETKESKGPAILSMSAVGELFGEPMSASGAIPGDLVCLSGPVGLSALGRRIHSGDDLGIEPVQAERFLNAFIKPEPNWALGSFLTDQAKAKATINISNGLVPDLQRLARLSKVAVNADFSAVAFADNSLPVGPQLFNSPDNQLIMCLPPSSVELVKKWFPQVTIIGHILAGEGVRFVDSNGAPMDLERLELDEF